MKRQHTRTCRPSTSLFALPLPSRLNCNCLIPEFFHELLMKFRNPANPFGSRRQERRAEMQRTLFLAKAGSGYDADSRGVEQTRGIELIRLPTFFLGLCLCRLRQVNGWEEVQRCLRERSAEGCCIVCAFACWQ